MNNQIPYKSREVDFFGVMLELHERHNADKRASIQFAEEIGEEDGQFAGRNPQDLQTVYLLDVISCGLKRNRKPEPALPPAWKLFLIIPYLKYRAELKGVTKFNSQFSIEYLRNKLTDHEVVYLAREVWRLEGWKPDSERVKKKDEGQEPQ